MEVALQLGGCRLSRVWTALLQQRSWLSHLRAKIFSQEPTVEAALKGAQHGTSTSDEGIKGRGTSSHRDQCASSTFADLASGMPTTTDVYLWVPNLIGT